MAGRSRSTKKLQSVLFAAMSGSGQTVIVECVGMTMFMVAAVARIQIQRILTPGSSDASLRVGRGFSGFRNLATDGVAPHASIARRLL
jgi:hypothetical protein